MAQLTQQVLSLLNEEPLLRLADMAKRLNVSEWEVVSRLPAELVVTLTGGHSLSILEQVAKWGRVTTIIEVAGSIFEIKAPLPKGRVGHGYYNLMANSGELDGHLKLDAIAHISLQSKPHRGKEAYAIVFYDEHGHTIFKIYLGRCSQGKLFPEQVSAFHDLKELANV
ncbi:heme utilization cystosolic carrier protein HutX [Oceanisphaera avium]|uniref:HuvX protein n=1 Tax=Oceanisphaera avium TaxID=1903694 RepID=A0A1Y0CX96_9GAMM|nr:heme utilization cystosolic carrier protein HutX [Oceanisphaera avium]ART79455.1 HuvX protein [Oceanisphaera avium]